MKSAGRIWRRPPAFIIGTEDGGEERAARIVLATGVSDTLPEIPGLQERWGRSALHCPYCHGFEVSGGKLGVLANHPHSAHSAMMIPDWGQTTYFAQALFEPDEEQLVKLTARGVRIERSPIVELLGDNPKLEAVRLADGRVVPLDAVFVAPKTAMASPVAEQLGCTFDDGPFGPVIRTGDNKETTIKGVFAAGDAASAMHNATLASAAGVLAGVHCHQSLVMQFGGPSCPTSQSSKTDIMSMREQARRNWFEATHTPHITRLLALSVLLPAIYAAHAYFPWACAQGDI
jgi:thioredoxin reductase